MVLSNFESTLATIIEENVEKGRQEGMKKSRFQIIKAMLNLKVSDEIIIATTGINKEELERVKKKQEV